jgi:hypothetical protein
MSAIVGERDALLQATAERFSTVAEGKNIVLSAVPPLFHLNADGTPTAPSIAVTAKPINLVGPIEFSAAGATLTVNGNVATVDFANVTSDTVVVQAKIREFGVDHVNQYVISTVRDGQNGNPGLAGLNTAQAFAYKRAATAPTESPGDVIYTFASGAITTPAGNDLASGWSKNIPAGTAPLYVRVASASSRNATDAIAAAEWTSAVLLAKDGSPGSPGEPGSPGAPGSPGSPGADGLNVASVRIYRRGTTNVAPALPTAATTFTFATGALVGLNNGWQTQVPTSDGAYLFTSGATAASTSATDEIPASEWSAATRLAADGAAGQRGTITITAPGYSTWSDASAVYEIGQAGYGEPINRDMVTLYDATHAVTKFYVNGSWFDAGTVINGNLLVAGTVAAEALDVDRLSAIAADLGSILAGDIRIGDEASGRYFHLTRDGDVYASKFSIVNGSPIFGGMLAAAGGTFAGELVAATGTIGLLRSRATGGRLQWEGDELTVFNESDTRRVLIGLLPGSANRAAGWGMQTFDDNETVEWDSRDVAGGVIATVATYEAAGTGVLLFPEFSGRSVQIVPDRVWFVGADDTVVADTAMGYPRVTITVASAPRRFMVVVF